jgi:biopolymer transport protein ExbB/TolQ/exonuclease VII small subunit
MQFECPHCQQSLLAEPSQHGQQLSCPSCGKGFRVPDAPEAGTLSKQEGSTRVTRQGWEETDPSNPNFIKGLSIGAGGLFLWYLILFPFVAKEGVPHADYSTMNFIASLFYGHLAVSVLNTLFFFWAMAIVYLKIGMLKRQKSALLLDVLPLQLGQEITEQNVGIFIDHLYSLPEKLRDSMMVNRIRKALEFFEVRQNSGDVREMMNSQSEIDAARINGSFILLKAFLWAIPLLGFIGTVIGLSSAIGGMNFSNVSDVSKVVEAINNVTAGLGTAFDATLLGLVLAMTLNFPLNSLLKQEDDNLSNIDAFCNEVLLPRLVDGEAVGERHATLSEISDGSLVQIFRESQRDFLARLEQLSVSMSQQALSMDQKMAEFQQTVSQELITRTAEMRAESLQTTQQAVNESLGKVGEYIAGVEGSFKTFNQSLLVITQQQIARSDKSFEESLSQATKHLSGLESGIKSLNSVLAQLDGKQVVVNVTKKKGWFSRE